MKNLDINYDFFKDHRNLEYVTVKEMKKITGFLALLATGGALLIGYQTKNISYTLASYALALTCLEIPTLQNVYGINRSKKELKRFVEYLKCYDIKTTVENLINGKIIRSVYSKENDDISFVRTLAFQNDNNEINLLRQEDINELGKKEIRKIQIYDTYESAKFIEKNKIKGFNITNK